MKSTDVVTMSYYANMVYDHVRQFWYQLIKINTNEYNTNNNIQRSTTNRAHTQGQHDWYLLQIT